MAQQIKNFWLKLGTMFLTLYFAPLSHFFASLFGRSDAVAGVLRCTTSGDTHECIGESDRVVSEGTTIHCTCPEDSSKIFDLTCNYVDDMSPWWDEAPGGYRFSRTVCYVPDACSPNGSTEDCSTATQYGTRTCVNGRWSGCKMGNCKPGYIMVNASCYANCEMENGEGYEMDFSSSSSSTTA